ncbi:MAG: hypothetical protein RLY16_1988 [Bacteroidota bacterium]
MKSVNYGIDLGTTNSLIARYDQNKVTVYKNPIGQKDTLASVVAYRNDRIMIGDKAREYLVKDPVNVFGGFKRKMGTDEKFYVVNIDENVTPVELSSLVLKELKNFVPEKLEACVITIPASFDSMQSNATLKAGQLAGFKEVFLLQEPIAASLAFFNQGNLTGEKHGYWLVYDLGGGTFDVALVQSSEEDLKVVDHKGNNFLGGLDFDFVLIDKIIVPAIIEKTNYPNFEEEFRVKYGKFEMLYYQLLYYAEEAKKELSQSESTYIEFETNIDGKDYEFSINITKAQAEALFAPIIDETIHLIESMLSDNQLKPSDINQIILVGGSTYLPAVRNKLAEAVGIPLNYSIDPTTSIAVGAAYYAANKYYTPEEELIAAKEESHVEVDNLLKSVDFYAPDLDVEVIYSKTSRDTEEVLLIAATGAIENKYYRLTRNDGGFDSGYLPLRSKKSEFLPLLPEHVNHFQLRIFNEGQIPIEGLTKEISISHGIFNIDGQPIPHDISIEIDDIENGVTKLEVIFEKNSMLPQKRTLYREISKTIKKGSDDAIIINILEGDKNARPSSNLTIGSIEIAGKDLQIDLLKGSDIEIELHLNDSRVLSTAVFLVMTQQEFKNVFALSEKQIHIQRLKDQYIQLEQELTQSVKKFQYNDDKLWEIKATNLLDSLQSFSVRLFKLKDKDKSDEKYVLAEKIRLISQEADKLGGNERIAAMIEEYFHHKEQVQEALQMVNFDKDELTKSFNRLSQNEAAVVGSKNVSFIQNKIDQLFELYRRVLSATIGFLINIFIEYKTYESGWFKDYNAAKKLMVMADKALAEEKFVEFRHLVFSISALLHSSNRTIHKDFKGTGIG